MRRPFSWLLLTCVVASCDSQPEQETGAPAGSAAAAAPESSMDEVTPTPEPVATPDRDATSNDAAIQNVSGNDGAAKPAESNPVTATGPGSPSQPTPSVANASPTRPPTQRPPGTQDPTRGPSSPTPAPGSPEEAQLLSTLFGDLYAYRVEEAIGNLDKLLELRPEDPWLHHQLGRTLTMESMQRDLDEAIATLRKAEELGQIQAKVDRARIHLDRGEHGDAQQALQEFLNHHREQRENKETQKRPGPVSPDPYVAQAHVQQGRFFLVSGQLEKVEPCLERGRKLAVRYMKHPDGNPLNGQQMGEQLQDVQILTTELRLAQERNDEAKAAALALARGKPDSASFRELYARTLDAAGDSAEADRQRRAAELIESLNERVKRTLVPLEDLEKDFAELEQIPPNSLLMRLVIARAAMARNEYARVIELCQEVRLEAQDVKLIGETWLMEARAQGLSGNNRRAVECFNEGASLMPPFLAPAIERMRQQLSGRRGN